MEFESFYALAQKSLSPVRLNARVKVGGTVCVLESASGKVYCGKNLVAACGLGYCAEQGAITEMLNAGESRIKALLVLDHDGALLPPCGKCLEVMTQLDETNRNATVYLSKEKTVTVGELYPLDWKQAKGQ